MAGRYEHSVRQNTERLARLLERGGSEHVIKILLSGHHSIMWQEQFLPALRWAFGD